MMPAKVVQQPCMGVKGVKEAELPYVEYHEGKTLVVL